MLVLNRGYELRDLLREECGLAAAINIPNASKYVCDCLILQEHRGEKGAGIISIKDGIFFKRRRVGLAREQFFEYNFKSKLPGKTAIGHNRYATQGDSDSIENVQPLVFKRSKFGPLMIAHNGTLVGQEEIKKSLEKEAVIFQSDTDSEIFGHLIARSKKPSLEEAIVDTLLQIPAAYSLLILTPNNVFAIRDRFGVRPLSIGKLGNGFLVCSENYAFDQYPKCKLVRDIEPGEMIVFDKNNSSFRSIKYAEAEEHFCIFEGIYFSSPRTSYNGFIHEDFRQELGKKVFEENPDIRGDFILPVLDSGKHAGIGLFKASDIPYKEYFLRIHNPPRSNSRSFTSATWEERIRTAYQKLHLRKDKIKKRRAIVVDDSIVRATTMKIINKRLRAAGASYIINCISSPRIIDVCPNGMDYQDKQQLVAANKSISETRDFIGADELIYITLEGLKEVVSRTYKCGICTGCFGGKYPE